jgi:hypothetical protein
MVGLVKAGTVTPSLEVPAGSRYMGSFLSCGSAERK